MHLASQTAGFKSTMFQIYFTVWPHLDVENEQEIQWNDFFWNGCPAVFYENEVEPP